MSGSGKASAHASAGDVSFLVDTNVWIDFFVDRSRRHEEAVDFIVVAQTRGVVLFTPIGATKDIYYIVASELKRMQLEEAGVVTESSARAADEVAWSCLSAVRKRSTVLGADSSDMIEAMVQRAAHGDYEDNLIVAAAMRARASHIITSDVQLQRHSPIPCVSIAEACALIA